MAPVAGPSRQVLELLKKLLKEESQAGQLSGIGGPGAQTLTMTLQQECNLMVFAGSLIVPPASLRQKGQ